jgi:hypothetical protein
VIEPFEPAFRDKPRRTTLKKRSTPRTPLEALDPRQLKLVGVSIKSKFFSKAYNRINEFS